MKKKDEQLKLYETIRSSEEVSIYLQTADNNFGAIGYKEHGARHALLTSRIAGNILKYLEYPEVEIEFARTAGYLHDIGNAISRNEHAKTGAILSLEILERLKVPYEKIIPVISAIGNHEDKDANVSSPVIAAVIIADKSDVNLSRIRTSDPSSLDTHGRANYACKKAFLRVKNEEKLIALELSIDVKICPVMDYFEIFLSRTNFCRKASQALGCKFELYINKDKYL